MRRWKLLFLSVVLVGCGSSTSDGSNTGGGAGTGASSGSGGGGTGGTTADAGGGTAGTGGTADAGCDDTVADLPNHPAGTCSNLGPICGPFCTHALPLLKPKMAYDSRSCQANACATQCGGTVAECLAVNTACIVSTLSSACVDPSTDASCQLVKTNCGDDTLACRALFDGLSDAGKAEVMTCVQAGCAQGLAGCVNEVFDPN